MNDRRFVKAIDWDRVNVGDPDPSSGRTKYRQCAESIICSRGEYEGGEFWCTREAGHRGVHVATDDVRVLARSAASPEESPPSPPGVVDHPEETP